MREGVAADGKPLHVHAHHVEQRQRDEPAAGTAAKEWRDLGHRLPPHVAYHILGQQAPGHAACDAVPIRCSDAWLDRDKRQEGAGGAEQGQPSLGLGSGSGLGVRDTVGIRIRIRVEVDA